MSDQQPLERAGSRRAARARSAERGSARRARWSRSSGERRGRGLAPTPSTSGCAMSWWRFRCSCTCVHRLCSALLIACILCALLMCALLINQKPTRDAHLTGRAQLPVQKLLCFWPSAGHNGVAPPGGRSGAAGAAGRAAAPGGRCPGASGGRRGRREAPAGAGALPCMRMRGRWLGRAGRLKCAVQARYRPAACKQLAALRRANGKEDMHCSHGHVADGPIACCSRE
jgi:hypothetical protein